MKNRIIKLTEAELLETVNKVISEQIANDLVIGVSADFGQFKDKFDGLRTFIDELTSKVNNALQGEQPYKVRLIKKKTFVGVSSDHGKSGDEFMMKVNLVPCTEDKRHYYFACAAAIYSQATDFEHLDSEVYRKAVRKTDSWPSKKIYNAGSDLFDLSGFQNLNPADPAKKYTLLISYVVGAPMVTSNVQADIEPAKASEPKSAPVAEPETLKSKFDAYERNKLSNAGHGKVGPKKNDTEVGQDIAKKETNESITKTVSGTFTSGDGDTAHNFKNLEDKLGPAMKEIYDAGINPKIKSVTAKITKDNNQFTTTYKAIVGQSDDGKAWMGFTSRGSFGNDYIRRADGQISGSSNKDGRSLEEKLKGIGAGEINVITTYEDSAVPVKQYFVQFTKPNEFPPHK